VLNGIEMVENVQFADMDTDKLEVGVIDV